MSLTKLSFIISLSTALLMTPTMADPQWIWTSTATKSEKKATFRKTFTITKPVKSAQLNFTCDNGATAYLNGVQVAKNSDWNEPTRVQLNQKINIGENELRFDATNNDGVAGLVVSLRVVTISGEKLIIQSNGDWSAATTGTLNFKPAAVVGKYGDPPWGDALKPKTDVTVPEAADIKVTTGFKVERLYTVPKEQQGSWVAITEDQRGRLITCDQYGGIYRITLPSDGTKTAPVVEPLTLPNGLNGKPLGGGHGLLYAFDSLYLMVNEKPDKGLWRLQDTDGDDQFDKASWISKCNGHGEHGPHGIVLAPDGKSIYFSNGNHTSLPENLIYHRPVAMNEDHLITRLWDANGHAKNILAPGGYVCKSDPDGKNVELIAGGFRNQYDIAFDANGELFTFDSDMEWDMGSPWYLPTRINHIVSGGDYGWRSGAGRWPSYYADSLPAVVDIGPGSPTGTIFGTGAKFPTKYQRALFALDWTFGTMWAIHLQPDGASFKAEAEEFVSGKPMPFTDAIIRREDGAMYFTTGGRESQSALYRVTYIGSENTAPAAEVKPNATVGQRKMLEKLHEQGTGIEAIDKAWPSLASNDRFIRFAARAAIERQPQGAWASRALAETDPQASIEAIIALARVGDRALQPQLITSLERLHFSKLPGELHLPYLRAWQLVFTRMGKPDESLRADITKRLDPLFPDADPQVNRELVSLLVYLGSESIVAKSVALLDNAKDIQVTVTSDAVLGRNAGYASAVASMHDSQPNRQAIAYAYALREARAGWTPELRKTYFTWFPSTF
jgi:hypothetical protein